QTCALPICLIVSMAGIFFRHWVRAVAEVPGIGDGRRAGGAVRKVDRLAYDFRAIMRKAGFRRLAPVPEGMEHGAAEAGVGFWVGFAAHGPAVVVGGGNYCFHLRYVPDDDVLVGNVFTIDKQVWALDMIIIAAV